MTVFSTPEWLEHEREIIESIRSPDTKLSAQAQTIYVTVYTPRLLAILRRWSVNDTFAEDLCQQTWEQALPLLRDGRFVPDPGRISLGWLIRIGVNTAKFWKRSWTRESKRHHRLRLQGMFQQGGSPSPEHDLARSELCARLHAAINSLPRAQRDAIRRVHLTGIHDPAERRRLSGNVCKGLQKLRIILEAEELGYVEDF